MAAFLPKACCPCEIVTGPCEAPCCIQVVNVSNMRSCSGGCDYIGQPPSTSRCSSFTLGPFDVISPVFSPGCGGSELIGKASMVLEFDNFGYAEGYNGEKLMSTNQDSDACDFGVISGTLRAEVVQDDDGTRLKIKLFVQNAPHGGPYGVTGAVSFSFS